MLLWKPSKGETGSNVSQLASEETRRARVAGGEGGPTETQR